MKKMASLYSLILLFFFLGGCAQEEPGSKTVVVKNPADIERTQETVELDVSDFQEIISGSGADSLWVKDESTGNYLVTQVIDLDLDDIPDALLFQVDLAPKEEKEFLVTMKADEGARRPESQYKTYSRFVPERTDDYTWENDKVAFRTYGPEAQRLVEENEPGGTLSSGIDLWLKRVSYSIIDDWYAKNLETEGYYHTDRGEGYDPYHVGKSRGTGGIGVWEDGELLTSENFTDYRTIATGPIRTVFELDYAPWSEYEIKETKRISLDLGSNFSKFEIHLDAENEVPNYAIGITLHDGDGEVELNASDGWFRYWEEIDGSMVGEGVVIDPAAVDSAFTHRSDVPDQSQLFILTKPQAVLSYYAGFAWEKSGQVNAVENWDEMLKKQAAILANPLEATVN